MKPEPTMTGALLTWSRLAPAECQAREDLYVFYVRLNRTSFGLPMAGNLMPQQSATLLSAVIQAVQARRFAWELRSWRWTDRHNVEHLVTSATVNNNHQHHGSNPGKTLLLAYLNTLGKEGPTA